MPCIIRFLVVCGKRFEPGNVHEEVERTFEVRKTKRALPQVIQLTNAGQRAKSCN